MKVPAVQEIYNSVKEWMKDTDLEAQIEAYQNVIDDIELYADKYCIQLEGREE